MTSESSLIERQMADVELRPFTIDEFHRRRHQKQRNRRIATGVMGVALAAVVAGGVLQSLSTDDERVNTDILGPTPSPFAGTWTSTDTDGSSQTMVIQHTDADEHEVVLHDDAATACSGAPATLIGAGRLTSVTELVLPRPLAVCDDGSVPTAPDGRPLAEVLASLTFVHDPATGELVDNFGVVWRQGGSSDDANAALEGTSPFEGSWVVGREGRYFPDSLEIRRVGDEDQHELVMRKAETPQCAGGASTMSGTGRREIDRQQYPGLVRLAVVVDLTCDDGSTPIPQSPAEEGAFDDLAISFIHDPVTNELLGSLGSLFIRQGAELAQGDSMATVDRMFDAVNARDADAFIDVFAPDGRFDPRGGFEDAAFEQPISEEPEVRAWMAIQDAWGFEADVISCTADPAQPLNSGSENDGWIECEIASRWPKLSLEIIERWRFELRGERLVHWQPVPLVLDPSEREMPLGFPGLESWETWLAANHPEDAARWLNPSADASASGNPEEEARLAYATSEARETWVIDGFPFRPTRLVPYDPAFADEIEASIHEYLEEQ